MQRRLVQACLLLISIIFTTQRSGSESSGRAEEIATSVFIFDLLTLLLLQDFVAGICNLEDHTCNKDES